MNKIDSYLKILHINNKKIDDVSIKDIEKHYKKRAIHLHPDKNPHKKIDNDFKELIEAKEFLIKYKNGEIEENDEIDLTDILQNMEDEFRDLFINPVIIKPIDAVINPLMMFASVLEMDELPKNYKTLVDRDKDRFEVINDDLPPKPSPIYSIQKVSYDKNSGIIEIIINGDVNFYIYNSIDNISLKFKNKEYNFPLKINQKKYSKKEIKKIKKSGEIIDKISYNQENYEFILKFY